MNFMDLEEVSDEDLRKKVRELMDQKYKLTKPLSDDLAKLFDEIKSRRPKFSLFKPSTWLLHS